MDAQTTSPTPAALAALVQCLARLEVEQGYGRGEPLELPEVLDENRFLAARDGMRAGADRPVEARRVPAATRSRCSAACAPHAAALGCEDELDGVRRLAAEGGAERQLELAGGSDRLPGLVQALAELFLV